MSEAPAGEPDREGPRLGHAQGLPAGRGRADGLRALAGRGRLRARRRRLAREDDGRALRHHHAAAQRHRRPAPGSRGALRDRGPHDPAGTHAAAAGALAARRGPRLDRRPVGPAPRPRRRGHHARAARAGALPGADVALHGRDAPGHHGPAAPPGQLRRLGPRALHDGRGLGARRARRLHAPLRGRSRLPGPAARQLVPGLRHEHLRPRGHRHARGGHPLVGPLPPPAGGRGGRRRAERRRDDHRGHHAAGDDPRATRRWRSIPTTRATRALIGRTRAHPLRRPRRAHHRRRCRGPGLRHRRREGHACPRPHRLRDRRAPRPAARRRHDRRRRP